MNWLPKASLYNEQATKRAKQKAAHQSFLNTQSNLAATIGSIVVNNTAETTNIVAKAAMERLGYTKKA